MYYVCNNLVQGHYRVRADTITEPVDEVLPATSNTAAVEDFLHEKLFFTICLDNSALGFARPVNILLSLLRYSHKREEWKVGKTCMVGGRLRVYKEESGFTCKIVNGSLYLHHEFGDMVQAVLHVLTPVVKGQQENAVPD